MNPDLRTLSLISHHVRRFCRPPVDTDNLTADIWLEHWLGGTRVSVIAIYHRCVDELRRLRTELQANEIHTLLVVPPPSLPNLSGPEVAGLIQRANLTELQKQLLFQRFYLSRTLRQIGQELHLPPAAVGTLLYSTLDKLRSLTLYGG
jgi:DNA-directed RNA polymerase specialized sigma24 family protein